MTVTGWCLKSNKVSLRKGEFDHIRSSSAMPVTLILKRINLILKKLLDFWTFLLTLFFNEWSFFSVFIMTEHTGSKIWMTTWPHNREWLWITKYLILCICHQHLANETVQSKLSHFFCSATCYDLKFNGETDDGEVILEASS